MLSTTLKWQILEGMNFMLVSIKDLGEIFNSCSSNECSHGLVTGCFRLLAGDICIMDILQLWLSISFSPIVYFSFSQLIRYILLLYNSHLAVVPFFLILVTFFSDKLVTFIDHS